MLRVVLILGLAGLSYGRTSPHADLIEQYYKNGPEAGRYSNNLLEDALLDVVSDYYFNWLRYFGQQD